ncbi:MAG: hypothetical protein HQL21_00720 [Candidatus Omnitrophica bacterium]|nr:hypothetical protein [Candidatus Omnitrophota bacterium]
MKRIGIAASKMAQENIALYNFYVFLLASIFSLLVFVLSGFSLLIGFMILSFVSKGFVVFEGPTGFSPTFTICMAALAVVVGVMNIVAISMNIRLK